MSGKDSSSSDSSWESVDHAEEHSADEEHSAEEELSPEEELNVPHDLGGGDFFRATDELMDAQVPQTHMERGGGDSDSLENDWSLVYRLFMLLARDFREERLRRAVHDIQSSEEDIDADLEEGESPDDDAGWEDIASDDEQEV